MWVIKDFNNSYLNTLIHLARPIDIVDSLADNLMTSIFRLRFNNLAPFEKTGFVTSWSKERHVMLGMNSSKTILVRYILSYLCGTLYLDSSASWKKIFAFSVGVFLAFQPMPYLPEWVIWEWWAFQWQLIASENSRNFLLDFTFFISKSMNVVNLQLIINPEMGIVTIRYGSLRLAYCLLESRKLVFRSAFF